MSGAWLASYIVLWAVVAFQGVVIFVLLRQLGIMYLGTAQGVARDGLSPSARAPEFSLPDIDGRTVSLADFRGRQLVLIFGSPSCNPCRQLIPDLHRFVEDRRGELSAVFLCRGSVEEARRFASELDIRVPLAVHADESLAEQYRVRVTPFAFLIDGEGVVRGKGLANNYDHLEMLVNPTDHGKHGSNGTGSPPRVEEESR